MIEEIPVLKIGPILMVTIQTDLHDRLAEELQSALLEKLGATGASSVLIDITAMQIVDSFIGRVLSETARMARIMNGTSAAGIRLQSKLIGYWDQGRRAS